MSESPSPLSEPTQDNDALVIALLEIIPSLLRRINADVPLSCEPTDNDPGLREVSELRATPGQLSLLRILIDHGRCTMQELAEHLAVAPSTVTAMVKRLLAQGYVERSRDDQDWRAVWISPTERGRQVFTLFDQMRIAALRRRVASLEETELHSLIFALPALRRLITTDIADSDQK